MDTISRHMQPAVLSIEKMQFTVIHCCPQYSSSEKEYVKEEIEKQLFAVFGKYR